MIEQPDRQQAGLDSSSPDVPERSLAERARKHAATDRISTLSSHSAESPRHFQCSPATRAPGWYWHADESGFRLHREISTRNFPILLNVY